MSKSSAVPVMHLPSPRVPGAQDANALDCVPPGGWSLARRDVLERRLHFLYDRYKDRLSVTNAMRDYQEHRSRSLNWAAASTLGLLGANELSRVFLRSPLWHYSARSALPLAAVLAAPFVVAHGRSTAFLEEKTGALWRVHKARVAQGLEGRTYEPSGLYGADKLVDFASDHSWVTQLSAQDLFTGFQRKLVFENLFYRQNRSIQEYPHDHDDTRELRITADTPERMKKFRLKEGQAMMDVSAEDPALQNTDDSVFETYGRNLMPKVDRNLPVVDMGFDEEPFNDLQRDKLNRPIVYNSHAADHGTLSSLQHQPAWLQKLLVVAFQKPEKFATAARHWRQKLGLERIKRQHALEMREGSADRERMKAEISGYLDRVEQEEYLLPLQKVRMRLKDAKSAVSARPLTTLGAADDRRYFEYERFLGELHDGWKQQQQQQQQAGAGAGAGAGRGAPIAGQPGCFITPDGTWFHELEGTAADPRTVSEERWREHYEAMVEQQHKWDLAGHLAGHDDDWAWREEEKQRWVRDSNPYPGEPPLSDQDMLLPREIEERDRVLEAMDDEDEAEKYLAQWKLYHTPRDAMNQSLSENTEMTSAVNHPGITKGTAFNNTYLVRKFRDQLIDEELEAPGVNPEFVRQRRNLRVPRERRKNQALAADLAQAFPAYEPPAVAEELDELDELQDLTKPNLHARRALFGIFGDDIRRDEAYNPPEEGEEEGEGEGEGEAEEQGAEDEEAGDEEEEEEEEEPEFDLEAEYGKLKREEELAFTQERAQQAEAREHYEQSRASTPQFLFGVEFTRDLQPLSQSRLTREKYRFVEDLAEAYEPWNRPHLELILDSLPMHVFLDIKQPRKFHELPYDTNMNNPFRGPAYEDFWGYLRYDDYRAEMLNKRNIAPQISFWRRDY